MCGGVLAGAIDIVVLEEVAHFDPIGGCSVRVGSGTRIAARR